MPSLTPQEGAISKVDSLRDMLSSAYENFMEKKAVEEKRFLDVMDNLESAYNDAIAFINEIPNS